MFSEGREQVTSRQYQRYEFDARASAPYTLDDKFYTVAMHMNVSQDSRKVQLSSVSQSVSQSVRVQRVAWRVQEKNCAV